MMLSFDILESDFPLTDELEASRQRLKDEYEDIVILADELTNRQLKFELDLERFQTAVEALE